MKPYETILDNKIVSIKTNGHTIEFYTKQNYSMFTIEELKEIIANAESVNK